MGGDEMKSGALGRFGDWLRLLASSETLGEAPEAPVGRTRESLLAWLTKAETLQTDEPAAGKGRLPLLSLIFSSEPLPALEARGPVDGRSSFLRRLFASERLPVDPVGADAPGRGGRVKS